MKKIEWKLDIFRKYFENLNTGNGKSIHTIRSYSGTLNELQKHFNFQNIGELRNLTEDDFLEFYNKKAWKGDTLNTHIRNLSAFFHYLFGEDYFNYSFSKVKIGGKKYDKVPRKKRDILTKQEEELVIAATRNKQEKLMIAMMFKTALRRSEISNIKLSDISGCEIRITSKGGDEDHTYLNNRLCEMLNDYLISERDTDSEYLFYGVRGMDSESGKITGTSINTRLKECTKIAGINKNITAHSARRTAITRVAFQRSPRAAQLLARHKSYATTERYVQSTEEFVKEILLEND